MVPCLRGVVEKRPFGVADNIFERQFLEFGTFDEFVEVIDICLFVFAVVEFNGYASDYLPNNRAALNVHTACRGFGDPYGSEVCYL